MYDESESVSSSSISQSFVPSRDRCWETGDIIGVADPDAPLINDYFDCLRRPRPLFAAEASCKSVNSSFFR